MRIHSWKGKNEIAYKKEIYGLETVTLSCDGKDAGTVQSIDFLPSLTSYIDSTTSSDSVAIKQPSNASRQEANFRVVLDAS